MWYEEFNWAIMFILNTGINLYFFVSGDMQSSNDPRWMCVYISLVFGAVYLRCGRSLLPVFIAHGVVDTVGITAFYMGWADLIGR